MNILTSHEDIQALTRGYTGERSADGRPHVADDLPSYRPNRLAVLQRGSQPLLLSRR